MERDHQTTLPVVLITWCLSVGSISGALAGEYQVIGSPHPIVAVAGDDVVLPCSLPPPIDVQINAEKMTVMWSRPDLDKYVHVYRDGLNLVGDQNPSYRHRTYLFEGELINGNVSLKLFRVKLEDQGNYRCNISLGGKVTHSEFPLIVVPVSEPKISILGANNTGVVLQCEAKSWYPEPQLEWREGPKDSEERLLSAKDTQTHKEPDGRYTVRSNVTVKKTDTNITCRVQLMKINLKREAKFHVSGSSFQLTEPPSGLSVGARVGIGVVVVLGVIGGAVFFYYRRQKTSTQRAGSNAFFHRHRQKKSSQPAGSNDEDPERGEHPTQGITHHSVPEETHAERERIPLRELDPDIHKTNGGSR